MNPLAIDLDHILSQTEGLWKEFRDQRIFITGGTGFFGCWLLESFVWANEKLELKASAHVLSRNPEAFEKKAPHLFHHSSISFSQGDIRDFKYPNEQFSHAIHCAVYQKPANSEEDPLLMVNEMLEGTRRVMEFCSGAGVKKLLLISSGAVYGPMPPGSKKIPEDFSGSISPAKGASAYHHVRRMMETLGILYSTVHAFEVKIARCFSFIGPYLPLNGRFAVSDFIEQALMGEAITVKGDGTQVRSYLHTADLVCWLWTILCKGKSGCPYNVGSELPKTIREIAAEIAGESTPPLKVRVLGQSLHGVGQNQYVPDTTRARTLLGLRETILLPAAIKKTMNWYRLYYSGKET